MRRPGCAVLFLLLGCGDSTSANSNGNSDSQGESTACVPGYDGCPCTPEGLCLGDLECVDLQCVGGAASTASVPTGSASDSASAGSGDPVTASTSPVDTTGGSATLTGMSASDPSTGDSTVSSTGTTDGVGEADPGASASSADASTADTSAGTGGDTSSSSASASVGGETSETGDEVVCGDGVAEDGEVCDGADLQGKQCSDLGFLYGELACTPACAYDGSKCTDSNACGDGVVAPNILCYAPPVKFGMFNGITDVAIGEMNDDGHLDVVFGGLNDGTGIFFGEGDGTFQPDTKYNAVAMGSIASLIDINKDGHTDMVGMLGGEWVFYRNDGTGTLTYNIGYDRNGADYVEFADVDDDGWYDMLSCGVGTGKLLHFRHGQPGGLFGPTTSLMVDPTYSPTTCGFGDFNLDGLLDIWGVAASKLRIGHGDGDGKFALDPAVVAFKGSIFARATHLDDDMYLDMVGFSKDVNTNTKLNTLLGDATLFEDVGYSIMVPKDYEVQGLGGNYDGDDVMDVLVRVDSSSDMFVFRADGTGLYYDPVSLNPGLFLTDVAAGDLNEDGIEDFVATYYSPNQVGYAAQRVFLSDP